MLNHTAVTVSSEEKAIDLFESCLNLKRLYAFDITREIMLALFKLDTEAKAIVYDTTNSRIEVFVVNPMPEPGPIQHTCLSIPNRQEVLDKASSLNYQIRRFSRSDGDVIFLVDTDGNLFELKSS